MFLLGLCKRVATMGSVVLVVGACGGNGDDPGRGDSTSTSDGTAQPTSFTGTTSGSTSDTETDPTNDSGSTGMISGTGSSAECPDTHTCTPEAPTDWEGPIARATSLVASAVNPDCPETYPELAAESFDGITAEPATCSCSCGPAVDAACEPTTTLRFHDTSDTCSDPTPQAITLVAGACNNLSVSYPGSRYWQLEPVETVGGACEATSELVKDDAEFETRFTSCGGAEFLEGCADGNVCAPLPPNSFEAGLCIWREGEHQCPSTYPEQQISFLTLQDNRQCQTCTCGDPVGLCDSAAALLFNLGCTGGVGGVLPANNECGQTTAAVVNFASLSPGEPTAFCTPSAGLPTGEAVGANPITVCCG